MMKKTIAAGSLALLLAGAGLALAQGGPPQGPGPGPRFNAEDRAALTDARIAGLKAGLKLTPEQEKNWPAVEAAIRGLAKERADRMQARHDRVQAHRDARRGGDQAQAQRPAPDAIARLREGADAMTGRAAGLKKLADAAEPLYKSLDDAQKRRFSLLLRMGGRGGGHHHHMHRRAEAQ